ncbi:MAG: hypothetical protein A2583_04775 [Bdellovibrionales bacterium RIFOXYD1_FULL_53_11]|nr:MAG: hypothetical protein A2583_04775 [Bdellovibrionales bacterium RIFOXYD1_FULL_53_11]
MDAGRKKILLVDDEPDLLCFLSKAIELNQKDLIVDVAESGFKALEKLSDRTRSYDLVVSDMTMPKMNGMELLSRVKQLDPWNPPFVFISGITDVPLDKIFDKGACAFMSKPFEVEELLAEINWLLMRPPRFVRKTDTEEMAMTIDMRAALPGEGEGRNTVALGQHGMFVEMSGEVPAVGSFVAFNIHLDNEFISTMTGSGRVVWNRRKQTGVMKPGAGIRYFSLAGESEKELDAYIRSKKIISAIPAM